MPNDLSALLSLWEGYEPFAATVKIAVGGGSVEVLGLSGSSPSFVAASLAEAVGQQNGRPCPLLMVTAGMSEGERLAAELTAYLPRREIFVVPPRPEVEGEVAAASREWEWMRLAALAAAATSPTVVLVAPVESARQRVLAGVLDQSLAVAVGERLAPRAMVERLVALGYGRVDEVALPGQFAVRGAILDVYPPGQEPVRVEWFDDEIDSLRTVSVATQRSQAMIERIRIGPARELLVRSEAQDRAVGRIGKEASELQSQLYARGERAAAERAEAHFGRVLAAIREGRSIPGLERYLAALGTPVALTDVFSTPPLLIYHDAPRIQEALSGQDRDDQEAYRRRLERGDWLPLEAEAHVAGDLFYPTLARGALAEVTFALMAHGHGRRGTTLLHLVGRPAPRIHGQPELFQSELHHLVKARQRVVLAVRNAEAATVVRRHAVEAELPTRAGVPARGEVGILEGTLTQGFVLPEIALAVLAETELSGREVRAVVPRRGPPRPSIKLGELSPGDLVVHATHGIGRYLGVKTLTIQGQHKDYLHIGYAGEDTLYVPVDQLNLVQKYVGVEGADPKLSRMGGGEWARQKERVRRSVADIADQLVRLYALRESRPGFAFPPDTPWQREFEAAFPYQETEDQIRAASEIKRDMERARPMDRLLCGDVGYGKTEVALRAAFKAIMAGKQVAFLVPTTLLADQHYATAKARMAGYPIEVEVLSRFRTAAQQREIIKKLADGQIDLLVGTHRLLGKDVRFQDLGLLVVDEEHRFGVAHKERIKELKANVDVLTLTATPIPRTLHMALIGIRDMSVIETPPLDRIPVETVVTEFDPDLVREAIRRERERGGQVFYVQNRIRAMDASVSRLLKMFPDLRVAAVHGQMDETRIEDTMARFIQQDYDVLVATNIIESGLDIPNANTLVVEDSDRLGLAQLYQLRGRVGRSARLAYAYFTYHRDKVLTPEAEKRLEAIREFTELGAGYQIALRDLEIRGAGSLLGAEQHGFVASVGFEMYTELLAEAVRTLKGEAAPEGVDPQIEIPVDAYLPDVYIPEPRHKIGLYKRMVALADLKAVDAIADELLDRFGVRPEPVERLLETTRVRVLARSLRLAYVGLNRDRLVLRGSPASPIDGEAVKALARRYPGRLVPGPGRTPELAIRLSSRPGADGAAAEALFVALDALGVLKGALEIDAEATGG